MVRSRCAHERDQAVNDTDFTPRNAARSKSPGVPRKPAVVMQKAKKRAVA